MLSAAILDVDGTLVDTNYQHAIAWWRAFKSVGILLPVWRVHRHIGMGGDHIIAALAGGAAEERAGAEIRAAEKKFYAELIDEVELMQGAQELIEQLKHHGYEVVLASSAKQEELDHYLEMLDVGPMIDAYTSSIDVKATKPEPDLILAALAKVESDRAVMLGDSTWDCEAARRAGIPCIAVLTGGFSAAELLDAGAARVHQSLEELLTERGVAGFALAGA